MTQAVDLLEDPAAMRLALSPIPARLLALLATPASAAGLAAKLGIPRQKIGYHLRALEDANLIELAETRQRRGFTERLMVARTGALVVDPDILNAAPPREASAQDRYAAEHLVRAASTMVREVTRMRAVAEAEGSRLLTFTIEADVGFAAPSDLERFADRIAGAVANVARDFAPPEGGRSYRVTIAGHPSVEGMPAKQSIN